MPSRWDENGFLRQEGKLLQQNGTDGVDGRSPATATAAANPLHLRSALWAAGFSFCAGEVLTEVPYCPLLPHLFFGEELSMAARYVTSTIQSCCCDNTGLV